VPGSSHRAGGVTAIAVAVLTIALVAVALPARASSRARRPSLQLPVARPELVRGAATSDDPVKGPTWPRLVDGDISDWRGQATGFAGTTVYSAGELVYVDHLFDSYGADDGGDAARLAVLDRVEDRLAETYRLDPASRPEEHYGDAGRQDAADLLELRVAADGETVWLLARTTTMIDPARTALLVLADTRAGPGPAEIPFGAGLQSTAADVAVLLTLGGGRLVDLSTGRQVTEIPVAVNAGGYTNALEAAVPRALLEQKDGPRAPALRLAAATGLADDGSPGRLEDLPGPGANLANVAFRAREPVRTWFDREQALALGARSIDRFFSEVDLTRLTTGVTERFRPRPGYHERVFTSSAAISREAGMEGVHQHYGVYVPAGAGPDPLPLTFWMHWRGGKAHTAASFAPGTMGDLGEARGGLVVSARGRGEATWYLGKGHVDFLEVWDDVLRTFPVDRDRVYVAGHSMGGWAAWLLSTLYPDRFAAAFAVAGPVTQGSWTGLDLPGCDRYGSGGYSPCYVAANDGDPRVQHTRKLLDNLRHVPVVVFQPAADELVPTAGVARQAERLVELGYRHRHYLFPTYDHSSHPLVDEWAEGARYLDRFRRDPDPARVTYVRDMPFERSVEIGPSQFRDPERGLRFDFDRAYWMSELSPADPVRGRARFDGRSLAIAEVPLRAVLEAGGPSAPGQSGPFVMTGLGWAPDGRGVPPSPTNGFELTMTGARAVRLDLARMAVSTERPINASVVTDGRVELRLTGRWPRRPVVTLDGAPVAAVVDDGGLRVTQPPPPVPGAGRKVVIS
jgi:pimeloyl-ACP methyl ester carboxylesterase